MTRKYSLLIEGDESGYSAHVPELPAILVTGKSIDEVTRRATEAIQLYWESMQSGVSPTAFRKEIEVELPA
ncbi:MAG TPA: type II toxin-antitoxin system HicB family antitoxin [Nitrospira sp.]|nr:type II toxin-antitoxin system HicB family antitoxin [Nitrospira sp.]